MKVPASFLFVQQKFLKVRFGSKSIPLALLFFCFLGFGLLIPWLGFYWDDWPYSWYAHILGPAGFKKIFELDRPFLSYIYSLTAFIGGEKPVQWQAIGIICRWLASLALWWSLGLVWPRKPRQVAWIVFVFALYPGFGQQWISVIYSRAFILFASFNASLGCMIWAVLRFYAQPAVSTARKWMVYALVTLLALMMALFAYLSSEYFFGVELLRPFLLWFFLSAYERNWKRRIFQTVQFWFPFAIAWFAYGLWRLVYFQSVNYSVDSALSLMTTPGQALLQAVQLFVKTLLDANLTTWTDAFKLLVLPLDASTTWLTLVVIFTSLMLLAFYLFRCYPDKLSHLENENIDVNLNKEDDLWAKQAIFLGFVGIGASILPFWMASLPVELWFPWDRFYLAIMPGASFFLVGMLEWLLRSDWRKTLVFALLLSLSIGAHFENANTYRRDWNNMRSIFWQLTWRIPALEPGTMILTHELPLYRYSDNSLTAPLNWIYAPEYRGEGDMPYMLIYSKARLGRSLPAIAPDIDLAFDYRATRFRGSTSQSVVISQTSPACLRVLDPVYVNEKSIPGQPYQLTNLIPLSNIDWIVTDPEVAAYPFVEQFGEEPSHDWCYYLEKTELARQQADWKELVRLGDEAIEQGFAPHSSALSEWFALVEGYAHVGRWEDAERLSAQVHDMDVSLKPGLCGLWKRIGADLPESEGRANSFMQSINCE